MREIIENFDIDIFYMPWAVSTSYTYENMLDTLSEKRVEVHKAELGRTILSSGPIEITVLSPEEDTEYSDLNDASAVVRLQYGEKRNPWNEIECGSNYARSMASYALVPILSGFEFDMPANHIGFNPYKTDNFRCIWSLKDAWGFFEVKGKKAKLSIYEGKLTLKSFGLKFSNQIECLKIDGNELEFTFKNGKLNFEKTIIVRNMEIEYK